MTAERGPGRPDDGEPTGEQDPGRRLTPEEERRFEKLEALRDLLFEDERRHIDQLEQRVAEAEEHARNVSRVLPEAIALRAAEDKRLGEALSPTIEEALQVSVRKNPAAIANAIFPVIGPAIRRSVQSMLAGMMQRLNQALEQSFSLKSLRWRLEARRTGRPFAEIVLLNSLVYRVEHVFLIHEDTGLLLEHVALPTARSEDPDVVSGMLAAIRDFVRDSFDSGDGDELQTLTVGDVVVAVERGPSAILAAIVRGTPPVRFRGQMQEVLEHVHAEHGAELRAFDGDVSRYSGLRDVLATLLQEQRREPAVTGLSPGLRLAAIGAVVVLLVFGVSRWTAAAGRRSELRELVAALRGEPGLVVLAAERAGGRVRIEGLRDPDAADPARLVRRSRVAEEEVDFEWTEFASLEPGPTLARAKRLLDPPRSVSVRLADGVLSMRGRADQRWIDRALSIAPTLPGVRRVDASELGDPSVDRLMECRRYVEVLQVHYEPESLAPAEDDLTRLRHAVLKLDQAAREAGYRAGLDVRAAGPLGPERARALADALEDLPLARTRVNPTMGSSVVGLAEGSLGASSAGTSGAPSSNVSFAVALLEGADEPR